MTNTLAHQEPKVLEETIYTSPDFEFDIDPIDFLTTLDGFMHDIANNPKPETAERIFTALRDYQIITVDHSGSPRWITAPVTLKKQVVKNGLAERILHLVKTGGEWRGETKKKDRVEVQSCCALPVRVPVTAETKRELKSIDITPTSVKDLALTLTALHTMLHHAAESGSIGVFQNPYGAINLNRLKNWLDEHNDHSGWDMKDTLKLHSLAAITDDAVFTVTV